ncbi:MAG: TetR/AcrR family transcriptional regulator, partial [Chlorobi bacterium]|nr:TetR/AcrR family transcriptional regulator [Chlorobiota bacterium]
MRAKTRQAIMDAGLKLFAKKGYHGTSVADIAKEAGISKGLAYNYFKSKSDLAEAILFQSVEILNYYFNLFKEEKDPKRLLYLMITLTFKHLRENEEFWRLYTSFALQLEVSDKMKDLFSKIEKEFIDELAKIFRKLGIKNAKTEAYLLGAIFDGVSIDYLLNKEKY